MSADAGDVGDLFVRDRIAQANSIVVGTVIEEHEGRHLDPEERFDPEECEVEGIPAERCEPPTDQATIQHYDAVVEVESVIAGETRDTVLIRRNRTEVAAPDGEVEERTVAGFAVKPGDRVIVAVEPAMDGTTDHLVNVLLIVDGQVVANHWNPDNEFRSSFDGLSEQEAIEKLESIAKD